MNYYCTVESHKVFQFAESCNLISYAKNSLRGKLPDLTSVQGGKTVILNTA